MFRSGNLSVMRLALIGLLLAACGGSAALGTAAPATTAAAATATTAAATTAATASVAPSTASPATTATTSAPSTGSWTVGAASKAVVSVREQLVGLSLPSDAVLTTTGGTGTFALQADGTFNADSKITFDLTTLTSDSRDRDNFVKQDTLQTRQFPKAELVPTRTTGLTLPPAERGTFTFKLTGNMTIHGTTKEVTCDVVAKRTGGELTATATLDPSVKFANFGMRVPSSFRVLSVVDEIRLVVELVAMGAAS